ncbi:hypothetical protein DRF65_14065 [Chryseobacterium pennae]|uniref:Uncharacterized protein n=1 Tax=Chryseobacterium pennae TaxID=2258962 RepID=A0A3D9C7X8_9FLAO|nr:hypothetical protein DRF65_14065 [Chryseobacterium pennae]
MIKVELPGSKIVEAIIEAEEYYLQVQGFFIKYDVVFDKVCMKIEPKEGFEFDPTDIFHLAWYVKDHMQHRDQ